MRRIDRELLDRWRRALDDVVGLDLDDWSPASVAAFDGAATRREQRDQEVRGPLAAFSRFAEISAELEAFLATQDPADPAVARARSAGAHADFEVAGRAMDLAVISAGVDAALVLDGLHRPEFDLADASDLTAVLLGAHDIRGGAVEVDSWTTVLDHELAVVIDAAAAGLTALDASRLREEVGDRFASCLSTLLEDDDVIGKLVDASAHAIAFLHRCALQLAHLGLRKVAGLCDDDVRAALAEWSAAAEAGAASSAADAVGRISGVHLTHRAWRCWSDAGVEVAAHLGAVAVSREEHLQHLRWAARAATVVGYVHAASHADPRTVPFAVFFGGVAFVGVAAWMLWAAGDHCREVADLV